MVGFIQKKFKSLYWSGLLSVEIWCSMSSSMYNTARKLPNPFSSSFLLLLDLLDLYVHQSVIRGHLADMYILFTQIWSHFLYILHKWSLFSQWKIVKLFKSHSCLNVCWKPFWGVFEKIPQLNHCYFKVRDKLQVISSVSTYQAYNDKRSACLAGITFIKLLKPGS